jgi:hypothetical protein
MNYDYSHCDVAPVHDKYHNLWHVVYREPGSDWQQITDIRGWPICFYQEWKALQFVGQCKRQRKD